MNQTRLQNGQKALVGEGARERKGGGGGGGGEIKEGYVIRLAVERKYYRLATQFS